MGKKLVEALQSISKIEGADELFDNIERERKTMTDRTIKLCKDCKHCKPNWLLWPNHYRIAKCYSPELSRAPSSPDLVSGKVGKICPSFCHVNREYNCGEEGKYWEPKK